MANAFVQVAPDSTGKKMQTFENTVSANLVEAEAVTLVRSSDNTEVGSSSQPLRVDPVGTTVQPVSGTVALSGTSAISGTVTANQGTSPWVENVSQFGGSAVVTGTGVSGAGIPRVTVSNDSAIVQGTAAANTAGWPTTMGGVTEGTAAWTSATGLNTTLQLATTGMSSVALYISESGSVTGGVLTFEVSDSVGFTNAYPILGVKAGVASVANTSVPAIVNIALNGLVNNIILFNVSGMLFFRIRLSTVIAGAGTVNVGLTASAATPNIGTGYQVCATGSLILAQSTAGAIAPADNLASNSIFQTNTSANFPISVAGTVFGGAFSGTPNANLQGWSKLRTPTVFKTATIAATSVTTSANPIWTPGSGNKFRLMRFQITAQGLAATASAAVTVTLVDSATTITIGTYDVDVPAVAGVVTGVNNISGGWIDIGNGFLSAAANNVLNFGISAAGAGTVGTYRINVCGVEE